MPIITANYIGSVPAEEYLSSAPQIRGGVIRCYDTGYYFMWTGDFWSRYTGLIENNLGTSRIPKTKTCSCCGNPSAAVGYSCKYCRNEVTDEN